MSDKNKTDGDSGLKKKWNHKTHKKMDLDCIILKYPNSERKTNGCSPSDVACNVNTCKCKRALAFSMKTQKGRIRWWEGLDHTNGHMCHRRSYKANSLCGINAACFVYKHIKCIEHVRAEAKPRASEMASNRSSLGCADTRPSTPCFGPYLSLGF